jgi:hypothetical protein
MAAPMKCTLKTFGTFSTPTFGGVGEPYNDGREVDQRMQGSQMFTNKQKKGQTGDNWNAGRYGRRVPIQRLYEGEKYKDPHKYEMEFNAKQRQQNLTTNGFRYPSPNKKDSGLGNYYGCIGPKHKHEPDFNVLTKEDKPGPVVHELRQVLTNPPKKGYGASMPGCIFGPGPAKGEMPKLGRYGGNEYTHSVDPYELAQKAEKAERLKEMEAIAGRPPLKPMSHAVDFFDGFGRVAASKVYTEDPIIPKKPPPPAEAPPVSERAFYPSRAPRSGPLGTFNKFPPYIEDPLSEKMKLAKAAAAAARLEGVAPFKPTGRGYSTPTPSIVFKHL